MNKNKYNPPKNISIHLESGRQDDQNYDLLKKIARILLKPSESIAGDESMKLRKVGCED